MIHARYGLPGIGRCLLLVLLFLIVGCARFHSQPLSASKSAEDFDARNLEGPGLRAFLESNLVSVPWPGAAWDLNSLTLAAFYHHPELDAARAKRDGARAGIVVAGERPNPSVTLSPTYDTTTPPPWILGLSFDIPVETAGKRRHRIRQAKSVLQSAELNLMAVAWQIRSRVRRGLLDLYLARQTEAVLKPQVEAQNKLVELLQQQVEAGALPALELTQARINLNTSQLTLRDAQRQAAEALAALADSLGIPTAALAKVDFSFDAFEKLPGQPSPELRRQAALSRTDILGALADYAASQAALQLELAKQYPDLHIGPGYQLDQTDNKWSLGATLTLPILNQNQGAILQAKARREEAAAHFVVVQSKALGEIDRAAVGYEAARAQVSTADQLVAELERRRESTREMFKAGEVDALVMAAADAEAGAIGLARLTSVSKAQQALAALEDAIQSPLLLPGHGKPWDRNPRPSQEAPAR